MVRRKDDAPEIRDFLESLGRQDWVRRSVRRSWPRFLYHYTDILNAVSILRDGCLYSRELAEETRRLRVSSGSPKVLDETDPSIKDCVRLYFRPKTRPNIVPRASCQR